jgi:hypothetical protein
MSFLLVHRKLTNYKTVYWRQLIICCFVERERESYLIGFTTIRPGASDIYINA